MIHFGKVFSSNNIIFYLSLFIFIFILFYFSFKLCFLIFNLFFYFYRVCQWNYIGEETKKILERLDNKNYTLESKYCCWKRAFLSNWFSVENLFIEHKEEKKKELEKHEIRLKELSNKKKLLENQISIEISKKKLFEKTVDNKISDISSQLDPIYSLKYRLDSTPSQIESLFIREITENRKKTQL